MLEIDKRALFFKPPTCQRLLNCFKILLLIIIYLSSHTFTSTTSLSFSYNIQPVQSYTVYKIVTKLPRRYYDIMIYSWPIVAHIYIRANLEVFILYTYIFIVCLNTPMLSAFIIFA